MQTLNPSRINPTMTAVYVGGKKKKVAKDQIYGMETSESTEHPAILELVYLGLIWPSFGDVEPEWFEDAKRLMVVMKKAVEVGLLTELLYNHLAHDITVKACESCRDQEAFTDDIRRRESEVEAKHHIKDGYHEWPGIGEGPPEWLEIQAEISRNFESMFLETLNSLDSDLPAVFKQKGWGHDGMGSSGEDDAVSLYAHKFFAGETIGY